MRPNERPFRPGSGCLDASGQAVRRFGFRIFPRAALAAKGGLHGAFAFPIMLGNEVIGVMEFFSSGIHLPDDDLLSMLAALGAQIGSFIQRERMADRLARYADPA